MSVATVVDASGAPVAACGIRGSREQEVTACANGCWTALSGTTCPVMISSRVILTSAPRLAAIACNVLRDALISECEIPSSNPLSHTPSSYMASCRHDRASATTSPHRMTPSITPPPSSKRHLSWLVRRAILSTLGRAGRRSLYSIWPCKSSSGISALNAISPQPSKLSLDVVPTSATVVTVHNG